MGNYESILTLALSNTLIFGYGIEVQAAEEKTPVLQQKVGKEHDEGHTATGFYFKLSTGEITGYVGEATDIVIPNEIDGVKMRKISDNVFKGKGITSVVLNEDLEEIGSYAFADNQLSTIKFNPKLRVISNNAFQDNKLKGELVIPAHIEEVGEYSFANNNIISIVPLGENTIINEGAITNSNKETILNYYKQGEKYFLDLKENSPLINMNKLGNLMLFNRDESGEKGERLDDSLMTIDKEKGRIYFDIDPGNLILNYSIYNEGINNEYQPSVVEIGFGQVTEVPLPEPPVEEVKPEGGKPEVPNPEVPNPEVPKPEVPNTGDVASVGALAMISLASFGGVMSFKKRRK